MSDRRVNLAVREAQLADYDAAIENLLASIENGQWSDLHELAETVREAQHEIRSTRLVT